MRASCLRVVFISRPVTLRRPAMNLRHLFLAIFVVLFGCSQPQSDPPSPTQAPLPEPEPEVDKTFMDAAAVEAWRAGIATQIEADAAVPHPRDIWRYTADFRVDRSKPDPILGDPSIWDAAKVADPGTDYGTTDAPAPRADEALALEAQDREWEAAQIWIVLGRLEDAKRCSTELEKEGEWKAVAMIAVHTGDLATLDRATKKMVGADQVIRTQDVAQYAFLNGKIDVAKHIAQTHGWEISEILSPYQIRELALKGDVSILVELLDREVTAWEKDDFSGLGRYFGPEVVVADIAILGKTDKVKAREYAARYLKLPAANVLIWIECGEGCYSTPVAGTLELYQLIRADQVLRELYFAHTRQAIDEMFPVAVAGEEKVEPATTILGIDPGSYSGWSTDMWENETERNLLTSYLIRVRAMNDRELTAFWVAMLDTFPNRSGTDGSLDFERELGLCALGLPFYQSVGAITSTQKLILEDLQGGANTQMEDTWEAWNKELPDDEYRREIAYIFHFLTRGEVSASREAAIRTELGIEQTPGEEQSLRYELRERFRRSLDAHYGHDCALEGEFGRAKDALRINVEAKGLRRERGLPEITLYPDTDAEYDDLMAPSLALLCEKLPAKCSRWPRLTPVPAELEAPTTEPTATPAVVSPTEPTNCTFVNGSRPQVGGKYVVTCDGGTFLANGEYKGGGVFAFGGFTPHTP